MTVDTKKDLSPLLSPLCIAVIGASERSGAGAFVFDNLRALGYQGRIIPVNPRYSEVHGLPCYPSLLDVPEESKIDCIALLLGYEQVMTVLEQAARRGIQGAWAFASGFAETGEEGAQRQRRLRDLCLEHKIMFCGPNCVGYVNLPEKVGTFSAPLSPTIQKGKIGVVAQSGSVILALANSNRGLGFSTLVSSGNEAVLDAVDYIEYFLDDGNTEVIVAFIEGLRRPGAFVRAAERALELQKPIVMLKIGRSELARKTVVTHTAALAGDDRVQEALFKKLGVIRVNDLDELLETAEAFVRCKHNPPKGNRVGAITLSGGEIGLMGDLSKDLSFSFPEISEDGRRMLRDRLPPFSAIRNPLDAWGRGDLAETYPACLEVMADEKDLDLIAVSQDGPTGMAAKQVSQYAEVAKAAVRTGSSGKPVVVFSHVSGGLDPTIKRILDKGNIPFLQGSRESLLAIDKLVQYGAFQRRRETTSTFSGQSPVHLDKILQELKGGRRTLPYVKCKELLAAYGIRTTEEMLARSQEEAFAVAQKIGYPVALKGVSPQIPHKTDAGLVRLNIRDKAELVVSFDKITQNARRYAPDSCLEGILVQEMVPSESVEVLIGILRDPSFGPAVVFGLGGVFVEVLQDTCIQMPPISLEEASTMISALKGKSIFEGFRGRDRADTDALAYTLVQVGRMALDLKDRLISLDLNPLMVLPGKEGVRAVDVLIDAGDAEGAEFQEAVDVR